MNRKFLRRMVLPLITACVALADCSGSSTTTPGPTTAFAVMRFTTSGATDTSFGAGSGAVTTVITPGLFDFALAAAVQPADNKIVVGGSTGLSGQGTIALVRYNIDGTLDTAGFGTAGTGGIVRTPMGGFSASASAIAIQPLDSKILVAALTVQTFTNATTTGIALLRYNINGTLDTGFGVNGNGIVTAAIGPGLPGDTCALALQSDGEIVVAGASQNGNVVLYRYNTDGTPDTGFGTSGGATTSLGVGTIAMSPGLALQSSGKIILVSGTSSDQVVLRYNNTDGTLDTTFGPPGANGIVVTDINNSVNFANAVAVQADDKIVVAGHANVDFNADTSDISLVRYNPDGTLDINFVGVNQTVPGIVTTDLGGSFDNVFSIALQAQLPADPLILLSGNAGSSGISQTVVLRYTPLGVLDMTFGANNGVVAVNMFGPSNIASGNAVVLQAVGGGVGIVVAGFD
jgi:uncharacterized delta-60 repeat protein